MSKTRMKRKKKEMRKKNRKPWKRTGEEKESRWKDWIPSVFAYMQGFRNKLVAPEAQEVAFNFQILGSQQAISDL